MSLTPEKRDFSNYELGDNPCRLAGSLLLEIAETAEYDLDTNPTEAQLKGLIGVLGPAKELQQNIDLVKKNLGTEAVDLVADWIDRSGIMVPVNRWFALPEVTTEKADVALLSGGVANWILRRTAVVCREDPATISEVLLPMGNREMKPAEHQLVRTWEVERNRLPTEAEFARDFVAGYIRDKAGHKKTRLIPVDSSVGDEVLAEVIRIKPDITEGHVRVVSNAPNAIQAAGQLRAVLRSHNPDFDDPSSPQLSMVSDGFPLARRGEGPAYHQNPFTALGQLARNALFLYMNSK